MRQTDSEKERKDIPGGEDHIPEKGEPEIIYEKKPEKKTPPATVGDPEPKKYAPKMFRLRGAAESVFGEVNRDFISGKSSSDLDRNDDKIKGKNVADGAGTYIALALCILTVICLATYGALRNVFDLKPVNVVSGTVKNPDKQPGTDTKIPDPVKTDPPLTGNSGTPDKTDEHTSAPVSGENGEIPVVFPDDGEVSGGEKVDDVPVYVRTYVMPVSGVVTKSFSDDIPVFSVTMNDYRTHPAVDVSCAVGSAVKCFSDGIVTSVEDDPLMGYTVTVDHENGLVSKYSNLSGDFPENVAVGAKVVTGQVIASVGDTALIECAQDPHLHFELYKNGAEIDPVSYWIP